MGEHDGFTQLPDLTVAVDDGGDAVLVRPEGELDIASGNRLRRALDEATARKLPIVLDLDRLTFTDASGLRLMLDAKTGLGERLTVRRPRAQVRRVMAVAGVDGKLRPAHDQDESAPPAPGANLQLVQRLWAAHRRGDRRCLTDLVGEEIQWRPWHGDGRILRGRRECVGFWAEHPAPPASPVFLLALGDDVVVSCEVALPDGGLKEVWSLYLFRDGELTHAISFERREDALCARARLRAA